MKFAADKMLGKLAKWLRILGFDTLYLESSFLSEIREKVTSGRIFLTRNRKLLTQIEGAVFVSSEQLDLQLRQLYKSGYIDFQEERWFNRCIRCNLPLEIISKKEADPSVPEYVRETAASFARCSRCGKVYWPGSHLNRMRERIRLIKLEVAGPVWGTEMPTLT